eukprot:TRINITY_DN734_c0_g1_i12.p1 TRINITY_DN734_c0_g1~~TRINITY_DN734_c0_g1_i12.p1  ORF type:complete len:818 (-),score=87.39 TRINITY_DN734_c0_g1_i12:616-2712(-)
MQANLYNESIVQVKLLEEELVESSIEGRLRSSLLKGYDSVTWPWNENGNQPVDVSIHLNVHKVVDLDLASGKLSLLVWLTINWNDPRLTWNPEDWNGIQDVSFQDDESYEDDEIWNPDIELWNAQEPIEFYLYPQPFCANYNGFIKWVRFGKVLVSCNINGLDSFPFDKTECNLEFGSWGYDGSKVLLNTSGSGFTFGGSLSSSKAANKFAQYDLLEDLFEVRKYVYLTDHDLTPLGENGWPVLLYRVVLQRQPTQYTAKIFVPQILLTFVGFGAFWLSPDCGERIGLVITIPLANAVYDLIMFEQLPDSRQMVFASAFGLGSFVFSMFVVMESVIVLFLWGKNDPYYADPWRSMQKLRLDFRDQREWVVLVRAIEEYLSKLAMLPDVVRRQKDCSIHKEMASSKSSNKKSFIYHLSKLLKLFDDQNKTKDKEVQQKKNTCQKKSKTFAYHLDTLHKIYQTKEPLTQENGSLDRQVSQDSDLDDKTSSQALSGQSQQEDGINQIESGQIQIITGLGQDSDLENNNETSLAPENEEPSIYESEHFVEVSGRIITSLADFQTRGDIKKFLRNVLDYHVEIKGRSYVKEAYDRQIARHGEVAIEKRIVLLLLVRDDGNVCMGANLKNYKREAALEYNLKWKMLSMMIDRISQFTIPLVFIIYLGVFLTVILNNASIDSSWFDNLTQEYVKANQRIGHVVEL